MVAVGVGLGVGVGDGDGEGVGVGVTVGVGLGEAVDVGDGDCACAGDATPMANAMAAVSTSVRAALISLARQNRDEQRMNVVPEKAPAQKCTKSRSAESDFRPVCAQRQSLGVRLKD